MTGTVYEIALPNGYGYVRVLRHHPTYGEILTVDQTVYGTPLQDVSALAADKIVIFPLSATARSQEVSFRRMSDTLTAPETPFLFKFAVRDQNGDPIYWWLWDGDEIQISGDDKDIADLPERKILTKKEFLSMWRGSAR